MNRVCENARISIRTARQIAQKQIRNDVRNGVVGKDEGNREMKKVSLVFFSQKVRLADTLIDGRCHKVTHNRGRQTSGANEAAY